MISRILPHATLCESAERIILLDVRQDRYLAVPPSLAGTLREWLANAEVPLPVRIRAMLERSGTLRPGDPPPTLTIEHVPAPRVKDMRNAASEPARDVGISGVIFAVTSTALRLRYQHLGTVLTRHAARRTYRARACIIDDARIAAFEHARRLVPLARNCLLDTLSLDSWLKHGGSESRIIFGVTALPFAAHCWLQHGNTVLNDSPDRVSRYAPILIV